MKIWHRSPWFTFGRPVTLLLAISLQACLYAKWAWADQNDIDSSSHVTEIPFTLYNNNLIIAKGAVGPVKGVNLILDTGTTPTTISKALAAKLKLKGSLEPLQTLNGVIQTQSVILPHIEVGAMSVGDLRVITQDLRFVEESLGTSVAGIVGVDVLKTHTFTIDYGKKKIRFEPFSRTKHMVQFDTESALLTVKASVEGQKLRLILDSGTSGLIVFRNRIKTPVAFRSVQGTFITTVAGIPQAKNFRTLVTFGDETAEHVVTIADVDPGTDAFDGLLGFTGMGFRKVSFDFKNGIFSWESD